RQRPARKRIREGRHERQPIVVRRNERSRAGKALLKSQRLNLALMWGHVDSKAAADDSLLVHRVRNSDARLDVLSIGGPRRSIAAVGISVAAQHSKLVRRQEKVRG